MRTLTLLLVAALLLAGCAPATPVESTLTPGGLAGVGGGETAAPDITSEPGTAVLGDGGGGPRGGNDVILIFERGGGFAGTYDKWTVLADGTVKSEAGTLQPVAVADVEALLSEAERLGFWEMDEAYGTNDSCADCFLYSLTFTQKGVTKTVTTTDAASDAPPELRELLSQVSALVAKAQTN